MKDYSTPRKDVLESNTTKEIVAKLVVAKEVERIYVTVSTIETHFKYLLIILVNKHCHPELNQLLPVMTKILLPYPDFYCRLYHVHYAVEEIKKGNLFFIHGLAPEKEVYRNPASEMPFQTGQVDSTELLQRVKLKFEKEIKKARSFKEGADFYKEKGNYPQAAFMLHQTVELLFRHAELFMMGKERICHRIHHHQKYIMPFVPEWGIIFNMEGEEEEPSLLKKLDSAYMAVRYDDDYQITKEQLSLIGSKTEWMHEKLIELFDSKFALFERECTNRNRYGDGRKGEASLFKDLNNQADEAAILQELQELTKEHFELLKPHPHKEGVFCAELLVEGYLDLLFTVSHLIKVCILALEAGESFTSTLIPQPVVNVGSVLELTLQLLPCEEGEYLDKIRGLLFKEQKA